MKKVNCATCNAEHTIEGIGAIFSVDWTCANGHQNRTDGVMIVSHQAFMPFQRVKTKALPPSDENADARRAHADDQAHGRD